MSSDWQNIPFAPASGTYVCKVEEVPEAGGLEVFFGEGKSAFRLLVLRRGEEVWGYQNNCPHFSLPLNFKPQHFLTMDGEFVVCAHHTAFFRFDDGICVEGPCNGERLLKVPVRNEGGEVFIG